MTFLDPSSAQADSAPAGPSLPDALTAVVRSAPELYQAPSVALSAASAPGDPTLNSQVAAHTGNLAATAQAVDQGAKRVGSPDLLHQTLGWFSHGVKDVLSLPGVSGGVKALNSGLQLAQHDYRFLHDVYTTKGAGTALLTTLGVLGGATVGAIGGSFAGDPVAGALLGAEGATGLIGELGVKDSWNRTSSGANYQGGMVSPGRDLATGLADLTGWDSLRPAKNRTNVMAGIGDSIFDLTMDPLVLGGQVTQAARAAAITPQTAEDVIRIGENSGRFQRAADDIAAMDKGKILTTYAKQYPSILPIADELGAATTRQEVIDTFARGLDEAKLGMASQPLPNMSLTRYLKSDLASRLASGDEPPSTAEILAGTGKGNQWAIRARELTNKLAVTYDAETQSLSGGRAGTKFDMWNPEHAPALKAFLKYSMPDHWADRVVDDFYATNDMGVKKAILEGAATRLVTLRGGTLENAQALAGQVAPNLLNADDIGQVRAHISGMLGGFDAGKSRLFALGPGGVDLSPLTDGTSQFAGAIREGQLGQATLPSLADVKEFAARGNAAKQLLNGLDSFAMNYITTPFKALATFTLGFAGRIAMAEMLPRMMADGAYDLLKSGAVASLAKFGYESASYVSPAANAANALKQAEVASAAAEAAKGTVDEASTRIAAEQARKVADTAADKVPSIAQTVFHVMSHPVMTAERKLGGMIPDWIKDTEAVQRSTDVIAGTGGQNVSPALLAGHHIGGEFGPAERASVTLNDLLDRAKVRWRAGTNYGAFSRNEADAMLPGGFAGAHQNWLAQIAHDKPQQAVVQAIRDAYGTPVEEVASVPSSTFYHGTASRLPGDALNPNQYEVGSGASNLFGPGVYVTDNPEVASSYTNKGFRRATKEGTAAKTVYGLEPGKSLNLIDLSQPIPADAREQFLRSFSGVQHAPLSPTELADIERRMASTPGDEIYKELKRDMADVGWTRDEADEHLQDLHDALAGRGYDGFRYNGGAYTNSTVRHNAAVIFDPSNLHVGNVTDLSPATRPATIAEARLAGQRAGRQAIDAMPDNLRSRFMTAYLPGVNADPLTNPLDDWARRLTEDSLGATHSPLTVQPNMDILNALADYDGSTVAPFRDGPLSVQSLANLDPSLAPSHVPGQERLFDSTSPLQRVIAVGHRNVIDPMINFLSRQPLFHLAYYKARDVLDPLAADGFTAEEIHNEAMNRATRNMIPFIHNTYERTQFAEAVHNWMPFYFAQEQAYRRMGRLLVSDPAAFRRYQLAITGYATFGQHVADANGQSYFAYPGSGFLSPKVVAALGQIGMPIAGSVPSAFSGRVQALNNVFPMNSSGSLLPNMGPIVTIATHAIGSLQPSLQPDLNTLGGPFANQGSALAQLIPNTPLRDLMVGLSHGQGPFGFGQTSYNSTLLATSQALQYHDDINPEVKAWVARKEANPSDDPSQPLAGPYPGRALPPLGAIDDKTKRNYLNRIRNQTMIGWMLKAFLAGVSPTGATMTIGDAGIQKDLRDELTAKGFAQGYFDFAQKHPDATAYTVSQSVGQDGTIIPATAPAEDFIATHADLFSKYPSAAAWLIPQPATAGKFDQQVYNQQVAQGLRTRKMPEQFLNDLYIASGNAQYYNVELPAYQQALKDATASGDPSRISAVHAAWSQTIQSMGLLNPEWWTDLRSGTRDVQRKEAVVQLQNIFDRGMAPPGPQSDMVRALLDDYNAYQQALLPGVSAASGVTNAQVTAQWKQYMAGLMVEQPELGPIIQKVFMSAPVLTRDANGNIVQSVEQAAA